MEVVVIITYAVFLLPLFWLLSNEPNGYNISIQTWKKKEKSCYPRFNYPSCKILVHFFNLSFIVFMFDVFHVSEAPRMCNELKFYVQAILIFMPLTLVGFDLLMPYSCVITYRDPKRKYLSNGLQSRLSQSCM